MSERTGEEIKGYMAYLGIVLGLLSGVTFFFPLSNVVLEIIPVYGEASLHAILASLWSTFLIWIIYSFRIDIAYGNPRYKQAIPIISFLGGIITFLDYRNLMFENPPMPDFNPRNRALLEYCLMFCLWTGAFTLSAMSEYMRANPKYILRYETQEAAIKNISQMTPDTKKDMGQKLLRILEETEFEDHEG